MNKIDIINILKTTFKNKNKQLHTYIGNEIKYLKKCIIQHMFLT